MITTVLQLPGLEQSHTECGAIKQVRGSALSVTLDSGVTTQHTKNYTKDTKYRFESTFSY